MSNPFEQNPWQSNSQQPTHGPLFGNAYEDEPVYGHANNMPGFSATGYNNAWSNESNKTQYDTNVYGTHNSSFLPSSQPHFSQQSPYSTNEPLRSNNVTNNAYQFTGTPYGNQTFLATTSSNNAKYDSRTESLAPSNAKVSVATTSSVGPEPWNGEIYHPPNKWRFWLRFVILLASIGHLGFAAGARPYSGEHIPFHTPACFYYLFAVAVLSIIYSLYHMILYCYRRMAKKSKMDRPIMIAIDLLLAVLWGIGVIVEAVKFKCTNGGKFCNFYNVSIFWGFLAFATYIVAILWDFLGACRGGRATKK